MSNLPHYDFVFDQCESQGCRLKIYEWGGGIINLLIDHPARGPIVVWTTFSGSIEETAKYACLSLPHVKGPASG